MNVLIVVATAAELFPLQIMLAEDNPARYKKLKINQLITGVGMLATGIRLSSFIQKQRPDLMIQVGIGGCYQNNLPLGSVYAIESEVIGDLGVQERAMWNDVFDLRLTDRNEMPFIDGRLAGSDQKLVSLSGVPSVPAITINEITTRPDRKTTLEARYSAVIESMEGAAFHWVGIENEIPFVQLRAVSNYVGERDKTKWKMQEAITNANRVLKDLLTRIDDDFVNTNAMGI